MFPQWEGARAERESERLRPRRVPKTTKGKILFFNKGQFKHKSVMCAWVLCYTRECFQLRKTIIKAVSRSVPLSLWIFQTIQKGVRLLPLMFPLAEETLEHHSWKKETNAASQFSFAVRPNSQHDRYCYHNDGSEECSSVTQSVISLCFIIKLSDIKLSTW